MYEVTKLGIDELRVVRPGTVLAIQKEGITGNPSSEVMDMTTIIEENGEVRQQRGFLAAMTAKQSTRLFNPGDRVYVNRISVIGNNLNFYISSVDTHDINIEGSTKQVRYTGTVRFLFPRESFGAMTASEVKQAVDQVLAVEQELAEAEPPTVEIGQSPEEIEGILGKPNRIIKAGDRTIYTYDDLKITFIDGKAAEIE